MLTLCALGVRDAYLISAGLVGLDPLIHAGTVGLLESLRMCGVHRPGLQLTASNEGASTMCSRVHLLANPSSPRLSPGGTNLFIADGLTYVVPVFIQPPRLLRAGSSPPGRVSSELVVQFLSKGIGSCEPSRLGSKEEFCRQCGLASN